MSWKLWVDDLREPPDEDWLWVDEVVTAKVTLAFGHPRCDLMSLDHDLGGDETTRPIVVWLIEQWGEGNDYWPAEVVVHSQNPAGREWLEKMIERYKPQS